MGDDFSDPVKRALSSRVGSLCSNPECRALTSGPQEDPAKALNIGVAGKVHRFAGNVPALLQLAGRVQWTSVGQRWLLLSDKPTAADEHGFSRKVVDGPLRSSGRRSGSKISENAGA